jgi:hypothetical protein
MRYKIVCLFLLLLASASVHAQHRLQGFEKHSKANARINPQTRNKIATHDDYPNLCLSFDWDSTATQWDSTYRTTFTYNINGLLLEELWEQYNGSAFENFTRSVNAYNGQMLRDTLTSWYWDGIAWQKDTRNEWTYDVNDNVAVSLEYFWSGSTWDTAYGQRYASTYVLGNRLVKQQQESWSSSTSWTKEYLSEFYYPSANGWDSAVFSAWNGTVWELQERYLDVTWYDFAKELPYYARIQRFTNPGWEDSDLFTATYGPFDSPTYIYQWWTGNAWENDYKDMEVFDAEEHQTLYEGFEWLGAWTQVDGYRSNYTYDGQGHTMEIINEAYIGSAYELGQRRVYSTFFTGLADAPHPDYVKAYPNPCNDRVQFALEAGTLGLVEITLYDMAGRLRAQSISQVGSEAAVAMPLSASLETGHYTYRIATTQGLYSGKLVIQH